MQKNDKARHRYKITATGPLNEVQQQIRQQHPGLSVERLEAVGPAQGEINPALMVKTWQ